MPWWSKKRSRDDPEVTPKITSIDLPAESPMIRPMSRLDDRWMTTSVPKVKPADLSVRSKTPHPALSKYLPHDVSENPRPRAASVAAGGRPVKSILKPPKPVVEDDIKKAPPKKGTDEPTKGHSRGRSSSMSNGAPKGILKPAKPLVEDDNYLNKPGIPTIPNKGRPLGPSDGAPANQKSSIKGGGKTCSLPSSKERPSENTSSHAAYAERYPPAHYYTAPPIAPQPVRPVVANRIEYQQLHPGMQPNYYPHPGYADAYGARSDMRRSSSHNGYSGHPHSSHPHIQPHRPHGAPYATQPAMYSVAPPVVPQQAPYPGYGAPQRPEHHQASAAQSAPDPYPSRYVKPTLSRRYVPQKDEEISLAWPFIDPTNKPARHQRWSHPQIYFDVGLNPTDANYGVRAYMSGGSGYTRPLREDEKNMPVSTHCTVTKMLIYCNDMEKWPIKVERAAGLRCIDVFEAIYKTFAVPLTEEEKSSYMPDYLRKCIPAWKQRCRDTPGLTAVNEASGLCRVDTLNTEKIFKGLSKKGREPAWTLTVENRPR